MDSRIKELGADRSSVQTKTFTKWVNMQLAKAGLKCENLYKDLRDGTKLLRLLEVISGETLPKPEKGKMRVHSMGNVSKALKFLQQNITTENIGVEDIVDGNPKLTLGLIWTVILRFQIQDISVDALSAKEALLLWCQRKTAGYPNVAVNDFSRSWSSGLAFNALIHKHRPDLVSFSDLSKEDPVANLNKAFDICEKEFGIAKLLDVEDVNVEKPDERSVMTYVAALYHYFTTAQQGNVAGRRVSHVVDFLAEMETMQDEYERMVTNLLEWIKAKRVQFDSRDFPDSVASLQAIMDDFKKHLSAEKPTKYVEKSNLEVHLFDLQTKLRSRQRPMYQPAVGRSVADINKAWKRLETSEHEHEVAVHEELQRIERLEQLAHRFNKKAERREAWLAETEKQLSATASTNQRDVHAVEAAQQKLESIESDVRAHEDRIDALTDLAEELDEGKFRNRAEITARDAAISARFANLDTLVTKQRNLLEQDARLARWYADADDAETALKDALSQLQSDDVGVDIESTSRMLEERALIASDVERHGTEIANLSTRKAALLPQVSPSSAGELDDVQAKLEALLKQVEDALAIRKKRLEQSLVGHRFNANVESELAWISDRELTAGSTDLGNDLNSARNLSQKHEAFVFEVNGHEPRLRAVVADGQSYKTLDLSPSELADADAKVSNLESSWNRLKDLSAQRSKALDNSLQVEQYHADANEVESWLMERDGFLQSADSGKDLESTEALLKKHAAEEAAIEAFGTNVDALGKQCEKLTKDGNSSAEIIGDRQHAIDEQYADLKDAAKNRRERLKNALKLYKFNREADSLETFLQSKEDIVDSDAIPNDLEHIEAYQRKFDKLEQDVAASQDKLQRVNDSADSLIKEEHPSSEEVKARKDALNDRFNKLKALSAEGKDKLHGARAVEQFTREVEEVRSWIAAKDTALTTNDFGHDVASVQDLQRRHETIERDIDALENKINSLNATADRLADEAAGDDGSNGNESQAKDVRDRQDELNSAWSALKTKSGDRSSKLAQAVSLQDFLARSREILAFINGLCDVITNEEIPKDLVRAEAVIAKHQERKGKMNANSEAVAALEKLGKQLVEDGHYASEEINSQLAKISNDQKNLATVWEEWSKKLNQNRELHFFNRDADQIDSWITGEETLLARQRESIPSSIEEVRIQTRRNEELLRTIAVEESNVARLDASANKLVSEQHYDSEAIGARRDSTLARFNALKESCSNYAGELASAKHLQQTLRDLTDAEQWVNDKFSNASTLDLPSSGGHDNGSNYSDADISDRLKRLEVFQAEIDANKERVSKASNNAQALVDNNHPNTPETLPDRITALKDNLKRLQETAGEKGSKLREAGRDQQFARAAKEMEVWLEEVEVALAADDEGKNLANCNALLDDLSRVDGEIVAHEPAMRELGQIAKDIAASGATDVGGASEKYDKLNQRFQQLPVLAAQRRAKLESSAAYQRFLRDVDDELSWIAEKDMNASSVDYGKNLTAAQSLQRKHITFDAELVAHEPRFVAVAASAEPILTKLGSGNESNAIADNLKEQLAKLNEKWAGLNQKARDRGTKIDANIEYLRLNADIDEEESWIKERQSVLQSTEHGDNLNATNALLKKHDESAANLTVHQERLKSILNEGEELLQRGHFQTEAIASRMENVEMSMAVLGDLSLKRRLRLEETRRFHLFENAASALVSWIREHDSFASSADFGKDLSSVSLLQRRHGIFLVTLEGFSSRISELTQLRDNLIASGHKDAEAIESRHSEVLALWSQFQDGVQRRTEKLDQEHQRYIKLEELLLLFAKKSGVFINWLENAEEDLTDAARVDSIAEIEALQKEYLRYQTSVTNIGEDFNTLSALSAELQEQHVTYNPYTPYTLETVTDKWEGFLTLLENRLNVLDKEAARQDNNEALRKKFADLANAFGTEIVAIRTAMVEGSSGKLEEQKQFVQGKLKHVHEVLNAKMKEVAKLGAELEKERIFNNSYTDHTSVSLNQQVEQLDQLGKRMLYNINQQIAAREKKGVSEEQLREFEQTFNHFDRDKSAHLNYTEFRACLKALGYDLPQPKEGEVDPEFERILSIVDANRDGSVTKEEFMSFMISRESDTVETPDEILEAFKKTAGDQPFVTKKQLVEALGEKTAQYCFRHMKPLGNDPDKLDYATFTKSMFTMSQEQQKREQDAKAHAKQEQDAEEKNALERENAKKAKELMAAEADANRRTKRKNRDEVRAKESSERQKREEERKALLQREREAKAEKDRVQREAAERRTREEKERREKEEHDRQEKEAKEKAERLAREEAELKAKAEAEQRAREAREEAERKAKEDAERKAKEEAAQKAKEEAQHKAQEELERKAREDAERKVREEAERAAREEVERKAKEESERRAREEQGKREREEQERQVREEKERIIREERERVAAEEQAKQEAEEKRRAEAEANERKARQAEADRKAADEAAERKIRDEEALKRAQQLESEKIARDEADRIAKEDADRKAKTEAEMKAASSVASPAAATVSTSEASSSSDKKSKKAEKEAAKKAEKEAKKAEKKKAEPAVEPSSPSSSSTSSASSSPAHSLAAANAVQNTAEEEELRQAALAVVVEDKKKRRSISGIFKKGK